MNQYYLTAFLLQCGVNFLLLCAVSLLLGDLCVYWRCAVAAAAGVLISAIAAVIGWDNSILYGSSMIVICVMAFGIRISAIVQSVVFCLFKIGLEGMGADNHLWWLLFLIAGIVTALVWRKGYGLYVPVEFSYGGKTVKLTALRDSGHNLRDPVSGKAVLVVDANVAGALTGLSCDQLKNPVDHLANTVGLRLIPYRSIGCSTGFLLAFSASQVKISGVKGNFVVAMAPQVLDEEGKFQALIGGIV